MCGRTTRVQETWIKVLRRRRNLHLWIDAHAALCPPCLEVWLTPFQLELWPDQLELMGGLPRTAPTLDHHQERPDHIAVSASWPRSSEHAWRDQRLSRLV